MDDEMGEEGDPKEGIDKFYDYAFAESSSSEKAGKQKPVSAREYVVTEFEEERQDCQKP